MKFDLVDSGSAYLFIDKNTDVLFKGIRKSGWVLSGMKKTLLDAEDNIASECRGNRIDINGQAVYVTFSFKHGFSWVYKGASYEVRTHKGSVKSIFKDDCQVGFYEFFPYPQNSVLLSIVLDSDADIILICSFILAMVCTFELAADIYTSSFRDSDKPFDVEWRPK